MSQTCESRKAGLPRSTSLHAPMISNPFVHKLRLTTRDKIQIGVMSVLVVPIRLVLLFLMLLLGWFFAAITLYGRTKEDEHKPLTGWRRRYLTPVVYWLGRGLFFSLGFQYLVRRGRPAPPSVAPLIVAAPHSTFLDAVVMFGLRIGHLASTVSRTENAKITLFGTLTRFTQPVLVSREDPNSRQNTIKEINRRAHSNGAWPHVLIFPEGTCTNRSCLIAFKPGAFYPAAPVQPVCIKYSNWSGLDTVSWTWEGPGALTVLWLTLCQFHTSVELEFLPVHIPTDEEKADPKLFARNVRDKMAKCLGVPTTDHTFEDCRLMLYASKMNFPAASGLVEFQKLSKKLGMTYEKMRELLQHFTEISQENKGSMTLAEFGRHLDMPESDTLRELFSMYDRDGSGTIDFREYLIGLQVVSKPANTEQVIQLAFKLFDSGNKGYITETELTDILNSAFKMAETDVHKLFCQVDADGDGRITYDEFKSYSEKRPDYAKLFMTYQELKAAREQEGDEDGFICSAGNPAGIPVTLTQNDGVKKEQ